MKSDNTDIFKPVGEMNNDEMAALAEDWDYETDHFLGYELKEDKKRACERMLDLCGKLRFKNSGFTFLPCGIDNRSRHASVHIRFPGPFLPGDKEMLKIFAELFSLSGLAVRAARSEGFLVALSIQDIWAAFVELAEGLG